MEGVSLSLFLVIFSLIMASLISPLLEIFDLSDSVGFSFLLTVCFSLLGVGLAFLYIRLKQLSSPVQRALKIGMFTFYPLILLFTYIVFGLSAFFALCLFLLKVVFIITVGALPLIFTYGFLRKIKGALLAPSIGIIVLFFFTFLLPNTENRLIITMDEPWSFLLVFIGYLCYLELAMSSLFFSFALEKMSSQKTERTFILGRFSDVINSYAVHLTIALVLGIALTGGIILLSDAFVSSPFTFLGMSLGSVSGIALFVVVMVASLLLFWLFSPMKKTKQQANPAQVKEE